MVLAVGAVVVVVVFFVVLGAAGGCFGVGLPPGKGLSGGGQFYARVAGGRQGQRRRGAKLDAVGKMHLHANAWNALVAEILYACDESRTVLIIAKDQPYRPANHIESICNTEPDVRLLTRLFVRAWVFGCSVLTPGRNRHQSKCKHKPCQSHSLHSRPFL